MGIFDFLKQPDINQGVNEYRNTDKAVLIDVRTPQEYKGGRIPGSKNIPLQNINKVESIVKAKDTPLFAYCLSGARSRQAVGGLQRMGYTNATSIGGISAYSGKVE